MGEGGYIPTKEGGDKMENPEGRESFEKKTTEKKKDRFSILEDEGGDFSKRNHQGLFSEEKMGKRGSTHESTHKKKQKRGGKGGAVNNLSDANK